MTLYKAFDIVPRSDVDVHNASWDCLSLFLSLKKVIKIYNGSMLQTPKTVCMDYQTHAKFSLQMAYLFAVGSVKAVVHAILPDFYVSSTIDLVKKFNNIYKMLDVGMRMKMRKLIKFLIF